MLKKSHFELPRLITQQIKQCVEAHASQSGAPVRDIQHLWINLAAADPADNGHAARSLNVEEWKNVVDEAASLGVRSMVVCVPENASVSQDVWEVCHWAQATYEMSVALYVQGAFDSTLEQEISKFDLTRTCLLVAQNRLAEAQPLVDAGISVYVADVGREDHPMPCPGPRNLVYVGANGKLYPCGLVHGSGQYLLGDVLEDSLAPMRRNESLRWNVEDECHARGCDACPNIMFKRGCGGCGG